MSTAFLPRSRSPVLSIRTQKEDEHALRAQIAAADRTQQEYRGTQHELLPRYSWHQGIGKRIPPAHPQERPHTLANEYTLSEPLSRSVTAVGDIVYDQSDVRPRQVAAQKFAFLRQATKAKKPWRQLSRRRLPPDGSRVDSRGMTASGKAVTELAKLPDPHRSQAHTSISDEKDPIRQDPSLGAWMQEQLEDMNTISSLPDALPRETQKKVRKSVYGSLASTKKFFRSASKVPPKASHDQAAAEAIVAPHLYSFDNKDQLRDYLYDTAIVSPLSPMESPYRSFDISKEKEPVELSGISSLPAELEGNGPHLPRRKPVAAPSDSTSSVQDLPPYVNDDKVFRSDLVKEQGRNSEHLGIRLSKAAYIDTTDSYTCSSCSTVIAIHQIHDFCSICDTGDRILCMKCAERGPCCQHELEQLLSHGPLDQTSLRDRPCVNGADVLDARTQVRNIPPEGQRIRARLNPDDRIRVSATPLTHTISSAQKSGPESSDDVLEKLGLAVQNLQLDLVREVSHMRREQDLTHRERELSLRSREIDLKGHEFALKEREATAQRNAETVNKSLDRILTYQRFAKSAFTGSRFDSQSTLVVDKNAPESTASTSPSKVLTVETDVDCQIQRPHHCDEVSEAVFEAEKSPLHTGDTDAHMKTCATQKRKKNSGNGSNGSTPAANSSPSQSRKSLSRGNSERDASQDEGDEEGDEGRRSPKKHKPEATTSDMPAVLFACPYAKYDPIRFSSRNTREKNYRGCAAHYLPDVSRLKQHLKRVHWHPEMYCPRCYEEFDNSTKLAEHAGCQVACASKICPFPEKMDKTQQEKIHVKRPRVAQETVWYDIYKVLFPSSPLPESPYMDSEDRIVTPVSATPHAVANTQAIQMLSGIFNDRLDQHEGLKNHLSRDFIDKTLMDSFAEILNVFSISASASTPTGPSIVVSPVSRSSSGIDQLSDSPPARDTKPEVERHPSVTTIASQPQQVPRLNHPRLPRRKIKTALEVPRDHHRSLSSQHNRSELVGSASPADIVFDINVPYHVQNDTGYDEECLSFEKGDDLQAMAFASKPTPPSSRNKSVMSVDSGYGSGRSHQHPNFQQNSQPPSASTFYQDMHPIGCTTSNDNQQLYNTNARIDFTEPDLSFVVPSLIDQYIIPNEHSAGNFHSYSDFLDQGTQDEISNGIDYPLSLHYNPWDYQYTRNSGI